MKIPRLYTVKEIAEILHMTPGGVLHFLKREKIGRRIGKRKFVTEKELQKLLEGEKAKG